MIVEQMKSKLVEARKAGQKVEADVLRVALGEIQTAEGRGETVDDDAATKIVRKLVKSNHETLEHTTEAERRETLELEIATLESFLPKSASADDIAAALAPVADAIRAANNDGQATGVAMKHLKSGGAAALNGAAIDGKTVSAAVRQIRA